MLGTTLSGRYYIIQPLGGGGFAQTYLAEDRQLPIQNQCVVKQLKPQSADPATLQIARRLFDTEAKVLYQLGTHDQIPRLFAYFEEHQEFYLVQEFIEGHNLSDELPPKNGTPFSEEQVIILLQNILEVLEFVHQQNVIHRDLSPHNIIRRDLDHQLCLIDFGAVKQITTQLTNPQVHHSLSVSIGTPGYMPSEQAHGNPKLSSDIYAIGIIGIQALTGLTPMQFPKDPDTEEIIWQDQAASVSPEFAKVLDTMVRYDFRQRYPTASAALNALKQLKQPTYATIPLIISPPKIPLPLQKSRGGFYLKGLMGIAAIGGLTVAGFYAFNSINTSNAEKLYHQGNTLYGLNRYEEALKSYNQALAIRPDYGEAWSQKGQTLYDLENYPDSLEAYDKAIQLNPNDLAAWVGRGYVLNQLEKYQAAIDSFDKALETQPNLATAWKGKADVLLNSQRFEEAIAAYNKAIEFQANYYEAWYKRGQSYQQLKQYQQAADSYQKALALKSDDAKLWYNLGSVLLEINQNQAAADAYKKAVRFQPTYYQAWYSRGSALLRLRQFEEAASAYQEAVRLKSNYYQAWYNLGWSYHELRRYEQAIDAYKKVIALQPTDFKAWYNLGNAFYNLNQYGEALDAYNQAINLNSNYAEALYSRGNSLVKLTRYQEALESYEKALRYQPNYQAAIRAKQDTERQLQLGNLNLNPPPIAPSPSPL